MALTTAGTGLAASACGGIYGGIRAIYLIDSPAITSFTAGATQHDFTAVTFAGLEYFEEINFERGQAELRESDVRNENNTDTNTVEIEFNVARMSVTQRFTIEEIKAHCQLIGVARMFTDDFVVVGYDSLFGAEAFLSYTSTTYTSGRALSDNNVGTLIFTAQHSELARMYTGAGGALSSEDIVCELTTGAVCPP